MRIVIDACIDPRLVEAFPDHHVQTLFDPGWQHLKDHVLVKQLECDVLITADRDSSTSTICWLEDVDYEGHSMA